MKNNIMTLVHIKKQLTASWPLCSALKGHIVHSNVPRGFTRGQLPALPGSCCHCHCHCHCPTHLPSICITPCRLEPCSTARNSSEGNQLLQPSTSARQRGSKALAVAGLQAFILLTNAELWVPRSRESVRKIQGFQYSLINNKILWALGASKQTETVSSYKKKGIFYTSCNGIYFQATFRSSL